MHSHEGNFTVSAQSIILYHKYENYTFEIIAMSLRGHWVK